MNKRLGRVLRSHVWLYFVMMGGFALATALMGQYVLAAAEAGLTIVVILAWMLHKRNRRWEIQQFLAKLTDVQVGTKGVESPFPTTVIRLPDGEIVYANDSFCSATGFSDGMTERTIGELVPGFPTDWLAAGKQEYPYDITVQNRRYRVFGNAVRGDDPAGTPLGVLRLVDLTELYQVRDE